MLLRSGRRHCVTKRLIFTPQSNLLACASVLVAPQPKTHTTIHNLKAEYDAEVAAKPRDNINITLQDDRVEVGKAWETSPKEIALKISKSLYERTVIARVNGELWDLERPLEESCKLELLDFEHPDGKKVFWHSSAHILGEAAERRYGCNLCIGPPVEDGFYYEMALPNGAAVQASDYKPLETIAQKAI
ncbi:hypothetical protein MRB53_039388 [Persea americana]|nr:hypothetical protein MRB53_039388 [Persea americana]